MKFSIYLNRRVFVMCFFSSGLLIGRRISRERKFTYPVSSKHEVHENIDSRNSDFSELFTENVGIDVRSHKLKSNIDVINEAQTIHLNIFKALIGKYRYAMLFGLAAYENKGDPAISVGEILLLQRLNIELVFNCFFRNCGSNLLDRTQALSKDYSNKTLVILLQGGGNLLSYIVNDYLREEVLSRFRDFEAILFPESIWPRSSISIQKRFQKSYSEHPRLSFVYRDGESYDKGKALFPKVRALLVPDMAFEIGPVPRTMPPTHNILWLRRSDAESSKYIIPSNVKYYDVSIGDWLQWKTPKGDTEIETIFDNSKYLHVSSKRASCHYRSSPWTYTFHPPWYPSCCIRPSQ